MITETVFLTLLGINMMHGPIKKTKKKKTWSIGFKSNCTIATVINITWFTGAALLVTQ